MGESALSKPKMSCLGGRTVPGTIDRETRVTTYWILLPNKLSHRENGIPPSDFLLMFRGAAAAAYGLQLPFLWIDPLCIFHDNLKDFKVEAASMREVYSNSTFNLSATANTSNQRSWFHSQKPQSIDPCVVHLQWKECHCRKYIIADPQFWYTGINVAPINTRA